MALPEQGRGLCVRFARRRWYVLLRCGYWQSVIETRALLTHLFVCLCVSS